MTIWSRSVVWIDAYGKQTITKINSATGASSVVGDLQNLSNAAPTQYWESVVTPVTIAPVAAPFQGVQDRASMVFQCADGTNYTVLVPAPKQSIFQADLSSVDLTNLDVVAFALAAITAPVCNQAGSPVTVLLAGTRLPFAQAPLP